MNQRKHFCNIFRFSLLLLLFVVAAGMSGCQTEIKNDWVTVPVNISEAKELQEQVDNGHLVGKLDPIQVSWEFLMREFLELENNFKSKDKALSVELVEESLEGKFLRATFDDGVTDEFTKIRGFRNIAAFTAKRC